jgi:formylglycine-generating enzyme required for sulfatase activity
MKEIPSGAILLRDDRKRTQWSVRIEPYYLSQYQVTQELYFEVTQQAPSNFQGKQHPVEEVSWFDAVNFCNLLSRALGLQECYSVKGEDVSFHDNTNGYRLPTDAEWEYACRAGNGNPRYGELNDIAWFEGNSQETTHSVGLKAANAWGLYDMLGNVWEWCWDVYDPEVYGSYRVFRGGGWADPERGCLASNRRRSHPTFAIDDLGFRVARSVS